MQIYRTISSSISNLASETWGIILYCIYNKFKFYSIISPDASLFKDMTDMHKLDSNSITGKNHWKMSI